MAPSPLRLSRCFPSFSSFLWIVFSFGIVREPAKTLSLLLLSIICGFTNLRLSLYLPRVSGDVGEAVRKKLGFDSSSVVEAQGFSEGIWLMWNESDFKINILASTNQFIHASIV
ncbi:hypothetical protein LINPERHAP1_LOCUS17417 [Linum perenne]